MSKQYEVLGTNASAKFTLKLHRGDGMVLLGMNWKQGKPPANFVGFAIEYKTPKGNEFKPIPNRLSFPKPDGSVNSVTLSSLESPFQKFRWVHFPPEADQAGNFTYRVTPMFMEAPRKLTSGAAQQAKLALQRETYPGKLNVAYTRGFICSQAFVDKYKTVTGILPGRGDDPLKFKTKNEGACAWMGFEARAVILDLLDKAIADSGAQVRVVAYDLNEPEVVERLEKLKNRLKVIIDNSGSHARKGSPENAAATRLQQSAGPDHVKREKMGKLQHNKFIAVLGPKVNAAICGSTNFSWRGIYVQNNNAVVLEGEAVAQRFFKTFDDYWEFPTAGKFTPKASEGWTPLGVPGINAQLAFSPHSAKNALLGSVASDVEKHTTSSLLYSLAFLYQTPGVIKNAVKKVSEDSKVLVYGISDRPVGGIDLKKPSGNPQPVYPSQLSKNLPEPFKSEPTGGSGVRMHHKFIVIDFDKPTARVYLGSYNFSKPADLQNGENLLVFRDRTIAVSYMVEALSMFDHYHFRVKQNAAKKAKPGTQAHKGLSLALPPEKAGEHAWWEEDYTDPQKKRDRELFS